MKKISYKLLLCAVLQLIATGAYASGTISHTAVEICKGESTTLTTNTIGDTYEWTPATGLSATDTQSITASPTATTTYTCKVTKKGGSMDTDNLISLGGFEFEPSQVEDYQRAQNKMGDDIDYQYLNFDSRGKNIAAGAVTTATNAKNVKTAYFYDTPPHSGNYMLVADGGNSPDARIWSARNLKLQAGVTYQFSVWAANIDIEYAKHGIASLAKLKFVIENEDNTSGKTLLEFTVAKTLGQWNEFKATFTAAKNYNWCHIYIVNYNTEYQGNDFALDDIYFGTEITNDDDVTTETFPVTVNPTLEETISDDVKQGEPYTKNGFNISASETAVLGTSTFYLKTVSKITGCDSIVTLNLHIHADEPHHYETVCVDESITLTPETTGVSYLWSDGSTGSTLTVTPTAEGVENYTCVVTTGIDPNLITTTEHFEVTAETCKLDHIDRNQITCQNTSLTLTTETEGISYSWSDGTQEIGTERSITIDTSTAGSFTYTCSVVKLDGGLTQEEIFNVTVNPILYEDITDQIYQGAEYSKNGFTVTADETEAGGTITKTKTVQSVITLCDSIVTLTLTVNPRLYEEIEDDSIDPIPVKPMPYFSPNDDGNNDLWLVEGIEYYPTAIIQIYDRYHKLLFSSKASDFTGWDGTYNGHPLPMTDYWYVIINEDVEHVMSGHFILKR